MGIKKKFAKIFRCFTLPSLFECTLEMKKMLINLFYGDRCFPASWGFNLKHSAIWQIMTKDNVFLTDQPIKDV